MVLRDWLKGWDVDDRLLMEKIVHADFSNDQNTWLSALKRSCATANIQALHALLAHGHPVPDVMQAMMYNECLEKMIYYQSLIRCAPEDGSGLIEWADHLEKYHQLFPLLLEAGIRPGHYQDFVPTGPLLKMLTCSRQGRHEILKDDDQVKEWAAWLVDCGAEVHTAHKALQTLPTPWPWLEAFIEEKHIEQEKALLEHHVQVHDGSARASPPSRRL